MSILSPVSYTHLDVYKRQQTLRNHCATELPPYMVPETIEFRASLPLMSNGKVDRRSLRES